MSLIAAQSASSFPVLNALILVPIIGALVVVLRRSELNFLMRHFSRHYDEAMYVAHLIWDSLRAFFLEERVLINLPQRYRQIGTQSRQLKD